MLATRSLKTAAGRGSEKVRQEMGQWEGPYTAFIDCLMHPFVVAGNRWCYPEARVHTPLQSKLFLLKRCNCCWVEKVFFLQALLYSCALEYSQMGRGPGADPTGFANGWSQGERVPASALPGLTGRNLFGKHPESWLEKRWRTRSYRAICYSDINPCGQVLT